MPEQNIFMITVKPAKVALFFEEKNVMEKPSTADRQKFIKPSQQQSPLQRQERPAHSQYIKWTDDMTNSAKTWVQQVLTLMGLPNAQFTVSVFGNNLKFHFKNPVTGNEAKERLLFSSFANLIMNTLRYRYKKPFRNLKVVLISG